MLHRQANMFCTKDKQCRNNRNTSKSTSISKCYNCGKSGHFSHDCQKSPMQSMLDAWAKKSNLSANVTEATNVKSVLVATVVCTSVYIKQIPDVEMTKILASQQTNVLTNTDKNILFKN